MCIILSLITCGIYGIYWEYCIVQDSNTASNEPYATSGGMVILLSIVTCGIYGLYWGLQKWQPHERRNGTGRTPL